MKKWQKILHNLLNPNKPILIGLPILSFSACFSILAAENFLYSWIAYIIYVLSAYSLVIWIVNFPKFIAFVKNCRSFIWNHSRLIGRIRKTKIGHRFFYDIRFRSSLSIYQGMAVSLIYVVFRIYAGITHTSLWFIAMAVYYMALAIIRFLLGHYDRKGHAIKNAQERLDYEMNCYQKTGIMMLFLNLAMGSMVVQMIWQNQGYRYPGLIIYFSAFYTFYTMTMSIINVIRFRKIGSPVLSASKIITLVSAMMSILGLQTAMIAEFGGDDERFRFQMNFATGAAVLCIVIIMSMYMILKAGRYRKGSKH